MSKEYVPREKVIKILEKYDLSDGSTLGYHSGAIECAISEIEMLPASDVREVQHEQWKEHGSKWQCTGCKGLINLDGTPQENLIYYCPNCGAKMDKEKTNELDKR